MMHDLSIAVYFALVRINNNNNIIIIIIVITFMQGIYNYIMETTMFLVYIVFQLFCIYSLCYM